MTPLWRNITAALLFALTAACVCLSQGPVYGLALLAILLAQSAAQILALRRHGEPFSAPYYVPMPNLFGTMGSTLPLDNPAPSRLALVDLGLWSTLAGFVLSTLALVIGIRWSSIVEQPAEGVVLQWQYSPLVRAFIRIQFGDLAADRRVVLHPLAAAGNAGTFLTMLGLFPLGQLNGAQIARGVFGPRAGSLAWLAAAVLILLGLKAHPIWLFFLVTTAFISLRPPASRENSVTISNLRKIALSFALLWGFLSFTPNPFELMMK